jgi:hypothetical protein
MTSLPMQSPGMFAIVYFRDSLITDPLGIRRVEIFMQALCRYINSYIDREFGSARERTQAWLVFKYISY